MSKWADIPPHVLEFIVEKGLDLEEIVALGLVCKAWRAVAAECKETFVKKQTQQMPWVMLPPKQGSNLRGFYSLARRKMYQISSPESIAKKGYSSRGWLVTLGSDWDMNLSHPLTFARFKLPPFRVFRACRYLYDEEDYVRLIHRVVLSASPSLGSNFVLMALRGSPPMPAYWRPHDRSWTSIETKGVAFANAVFHQDKCYFVDCKGTLFVTDFGVSNPTNARLVTEFTINLIRGEFFEAIYLVILEGALLLVSRIGSGWIRPEKEFEDRPYQTIDFQVFKFDFESLRWGELENLGNWSLFLGSNSSMALNASVVEECKPNCIYFTDDNLHLCYWTREGAGYDMGIFNMDDRTIEPIMDGEWRHRISPPVFVEPTF